MSEEKNPKFWDCGDPEILTYTEMNEAIEALLSDGGDTPKSLEVYGYDPKELPTVGWIKDRILSHMLEAFDEDYEDPENPQYATQAMEDAALLFAGTFRREYSVYSCEKVRTETINVREWMEKHRPDYLEDLESDE